jgi:hypothetical protein
MEGLAQRILNKEVPESIQGKRGQFHKKRKKLNTHSVLARHTDRVAYHQSSRLISPPWSLAPRFGVPLKKSSKLC